MFPARRTNVCSYPRFCIRPEFASALSPPRTMMLYTDGACPSNGLAKARGGFAFVFNETPGGQCSSALEHKGPDGQVHTPTSNRAELRAVIAALNFRSWGGEGWRRVVIVTDSEYVAKGATIRVRNWAARSWRTADGKPVANRDLWEALSEAMGSCAADGCEVSFWMVPREWNSLADTAAKAGSQLESRLEYGDICGVLC
ncbi:ribonuclease H-like domain-containing protein [Mycena polygramma]|nr:ribonuclease H-like domain-containing protein [Mycena polygramma]